MNDAPRPLTVGSEILLRDATLKVVSTDFERDCAFPDAVALAFSREYRPGSHVMTPWGYVRTVGELARAA